MNIKKLSYYLPVLAIAGAIALSSPNNTMVALAEEEEEELYIETEGGEQQEKIDEDTIVENVVTPVATPEPTPQITEATATKNENQAINADKNHYFDNTNYFPATDPSDNPGTTIPEGTKDEVDIKGLEPTPTPEKTPEPTPTPEKTPEPTPTPEKTPGPTPTPEKTPGPTPTPEKTPEPTPEKIAPPSLPKMGMDSYYFAEEAFVGTIGAAVIYGLYRLFKRIQLNRKLSNNRVELEKAEEKNKANAVKEKKLTK